MAKNKAKLKKGICGVAFAPAILSTVEGATKVEYGDVVNLITSDSGGRSYSIEPRGESQEIYADSVKVYGDTVNDGYDITLTLLSALDGMVNKAWLNEVATADGTAEYANVEEYPYFALILYENTTDGTGLTTIYSWVQATGRPSESGNTAEGGTFDFAYPEYSLAATPRPTDRLVRFKKRGIEKLTKVPEPVAAETTPTIEGGTE